MCDGNDLLKTTRQNGSTDDTRVEPFRHFWQQEQDHFEVPNFAKEFRFGGRTGPSYQNAAQTVREHPTVFQLFSLCP